MALTDVKPIASTTLYSDGNLVSAWALATNSTDSKGSNTGTDANMSYSSASLPNSNFSGYAVFGGTSKITKSSPVSVPTGTSSRSFSCMFKSNDTSTTQTMFDTGDSASNGNRFSGLALSGGTGTIYFTGNGADVGPGSNIADNIWHYIVFTYNGTTVLAYIDGSQNLTGTPSLNTAASTLLSFGMDNLAGENMHGNLADMTMFSRVLTPTEITAHWNGTDGTGGGGIVAAKSLTLLRT